MAVMHAVGKGRRAPIRARLQSAKGEYVIELDVSAFTEPELSVAVVGREVTVRGDQLVTPEDDGKPFRLRERLRESFRLPDDALADQIKAFYAPASLELHVPRAPLRLRSIPVERKRTFCINPDAEAC